MRRLLAAWLVMTLAAGCNATLVNKSAVVFPVLTGTVQIQWQLSTQGVHEVDYMLDGAVVASSSDATDLFAIAFDSTKVPNGMHTLRVIALDANGQPQRVISHTLLIKN